MRIAGGLRIIGMNRPRNTNAQAATAVPVAQMKRETEALEAGRPTALDLVARITLPINPGTAPVGHGR